MSSKNLDPFKSNKYQCLQFIQKDHKSVTCFDSETWNPLFTNTILRKLKIINIFTS